MARKAVVSGGTRDEIIAVSRRLFFEKGFDGVTIRNIQREVGCEVGLFYYYFKSKDQVFDMVMDQIQTEWSMEFDEAMAGSGENARDGLDAIVECMWKLVKNFSDEDDILHWSVRGALCERLSTVASKYIKELLNKTGISIRVSAETLSAVIAGGIGKILSETSYYGYLSIKDEIITLINAVIPEYRGRTKELSVELL